ncbi:hypothetical protein WBJ53_17805 [Spirosoma sp. SC4-14]|uniref:hypothetical protein n=1 Tax=Spirosoma sp. SC4-14 TaxID=3128900 RepID=UPI0030D000FB
MRPRVLINIMNVVRGGPEISLAKGSLTINGCDPFTWHGKDLKVYIRKAGERKEYYIQGLAVV